MTRRAGQRSEATRADLLKAATTEFAHHGFQKASLRAICSDAGVTTGALYFFFKNKEDLFREVIAPVERVFEELVGLLSTADLSAGGLESSHDSKEAGTYLRELYDNRDAVSVVLNSRDAPAVAEFFERAVDSSERQINAALSRNDGANIELDPFLVHWYAHLQVEMVLHTIEHSSSAEEAEVHMGKMALFVQGGLDGLSGRAGKDQGHDGAAE